MGGYHILFQRLRPYDEYDRVISGHLGVNRMNDSVRLLLLKLSICLI